MRKKETLHSDNMADVRAFISAGCSAMAMACIFLGLFTNVWLTAQEEETSEEIDFDTLTKIEVPTARELNGGLREFELTVKNPDGSATTDYEYSEMEEYVTNVNKMYEGLIETDKKEEEQVVDYYNGMDTVGLITYILLYASLIVCTGAIVFAILGGIGKMSGKTGMIIGFIGGFLILSSAMIFLLLRPSVPENLKGSMWDEAILGWSFYVVLVGGLIKCIAAGMMIPVKKKTEFRLEDDVRSDDHEMTAE